MPAMQHRMLDESDLIAVDKVLLDVLAEDGRATPQLLAFAIEDRTGESYTRQHISGRLKRLVEHSHVENVRDTGVYELVDDPRE